MISIYSVFLHFIKEEKLHAANFPISLTLKGRENYLRTYRLFFTFENGSFKK